MRALPYTTSPIKSTNITTLFITDGTSTDALQFVGNYNISVAWHLSADSKGGSLLTESPMDTGTPTSSADLPSTVAAALTTTGGSADQFTFQNDDHSSTLADATSPASTNPSAADASDTTQSSSDDATAAAPTTTVADASVTSNTQTTTTESTQTATPPQTATVSPTTTSATGDTFVFAPNFSNATIANFHPDTDTIEIDHSVFADFHALLAAAHNDATGNAVITADAHDSITIKNVTVSQLHQSDFHFT